MKKRKSVALIILEIPVVILSIFIAFSFVRLKFKSDQINDDYSSCFQNEKYRESVSVENVECITQDVSCGYAVIEMFSKWDGGDITEEKLYDEYGRVVTSTGKAFCEEMNKRFPEYNTRMYKYLTNSEMINLIYDSLYEGMPVPIEWAAEKDGVWTLHYSLVTGMDIPDNTVTVANPYGYYETVSLDEFLERTRFDAYDNIPLFFKAAFAFGVFEKNSIFVIMDKKSTENTIVSLMDDFRDKTKCESISCVTINDDEVRFYGNCDGLYQIGSMTKAFTGLTIQKLILEGKISEDDYVSDYIDGFEVYYNSGKAEISVRNLLEQKSGFTNSEKDYPSASEKMSLEEWAKNISGKELKSLPGTEYSYSNTNYNLLGLIIEKETGMTYKDYMEQEILRPLGLNNTYVEMTDEDGIIEGSRLGYRHSFKYILPVKKASIPAGYFYSNTKDMAVWMNIWMGKKEVPEVFSKAIEITKSRLTPEEDYYSGWELFSNGEIGHSGGTPNYSSRIVYSDKEKTAVCVLTNLNVASSSDSLCNTIFEVIKENNTQNLKVSSSEKKEKIAQDVWTVFDIVFSIITINGIIILLLALIIKHSKILIGLDSVLSLFLVLILILFPIIFGAGLKEILFIWAPISMVGGLAVMVLDILLITFKFLMVKKHARDYKAG